jgi:hypothetical protein
MGNGMAITTQGRLRRDSIRQTVIIQTSLLLKPASHNMTPTKRVCRIKQEGLPKHPRSDSQASRLRNTSPQQRWGKTRLSSIHSSTQCVHCQSKPRRAALLPVQLTIPLLLGGIFLVQEVSTQVLMHLFCRALGLHSRILQPPRLPSWQQ